jgi:hypothetical protein
VDKAVYANGCGDDDDDEDQHRKKLRPLDVLKLSS